jgi:D-alanyl-D-alanine carboxypeptidase
MLLITTLLFATIYSLNDSASAPYDGFDDRPDDVIETPDITDNPNDITNRDGEPDDEPDIIPTDNPNDDNHDIPEYAFVTMDEADIYDGFLLLVNRNHEFVIPDNLDVVNIVSFKTEPFRVLPPHYLLLRSVIGSLDKMMAEYVQSTRDRTVAINSAFRTVEQQEKVLNDRIARVGRTEAMRWVANPGFSEHHTGLAIDLIGYSGGYRMDFTGVGSTAWFRRNSYRFGWIRRYPPDKTRITMVPHEPWHFRYVGLPHSYIMFENNWALEEYLNILRDHTMDEPFIYEFEDIEYEIYFAEGLIVPIAFNREFVLSGNNVDGFIVTAHLPVDESIMFP